MKKYVEYGLISFVGLNANTVLAEDNDNTLKKRKFGEPESVKLSNNAVTTSLRLSMSRVHLPPEIWADVENLSNTWSVLIGAKLTPKEYTKAVNSLKISDTSKKHITSSKEYKILTSLASENNLALAKKGDYEQLINNLMAEGILDSNAESHLTNKIENLITKNKVIRATIEDGFNTNQTLNDVSQTDLEQLVSVFSASRVEPRACSVAAACVAFIAVAVVTYAGAAVNVAAALNVAVQISVAVNVAVTIDGCGVNCHEPYSVGSLERSMRDQLSLIEAFSKQSEIPMLYSKAIVDFKRKEARAVLQAVINLGMVSITDEQQETALRALDNIVLDSLGVVGEVQ
ncbi:hypothetical protein [Aeromonas sp. DNRA1]|uniref:hypothetical protein n=1 Tax=Aeromonas sp. DNRA1 TaxID=2729335 RepID=UPI0014597087|nr:hypothetical protein [Aeromonas sp. DNRA1]NME00366.1 hypothetical protein [Aeromonas sp. DNRA1]